MELGEGKRYPNCARASQPRRPLRSPGSDKIRSEMTPIPGPGLQEGAPRAGRAGPSEERNRRARARRAAAREMRPERAMSPLRAAAPERAASERSIVERQIARARRLAEDDLFDDEPLTLNEVRGARR